MRKIDKLAVLVAEVQRLIKEINAEKEQTGFEIISATADDLKGMSIHVFKGLDAIDEPITLTRREGESAKYYPIEKTAKIGGVKLFELVEEAANDASVAV